MLTFPLCAESRHEAAIRDLLEGCVDFVRRRLSPPTLQGVVLTGSFARGEGSVLTVPAGLKVLGDIEFFVVLERGADYQRLRPQMATWSSLAAAVPGARRIRASLEFGPVALGYLRRADPSIFIHDLRHHGKVLWGPPDLLDQMPPLRAEAIPREDALRLLLNRVVEQVDAHDRVPALDADAALDVSYQQLKIVLDLAGSALAFNGRHCASYAERPARLARLLRETPSLARRLPSGFERELAWAAAAKLAPDDYDFAGPDGETAVRRRALRERLVGVVPAMMGLLAWELAQIVGPHDDLDVLLDRYLAAQSLGRRAWEWTKLARNPLRAPLPLSPLAAARLFRRSTPRALIYAAGVRAYRELTGPPDPEPIERWLPLARRARPRDPEARRRAIVALWRWCVRNS